MSCGLLNAIGCESLSECVVEALGDVILDIVPVEAMHDDLDAKRQAGRYRYLVLAPTVVHATLIHVVECRGEDQSILVGLIEIQLRPVIETRAVWQVVLNELAGPLDVNLLPLLIAGVLAVDDGCA